MAGVALLAFVPAAAGLVIAGLRRPAVMLALYGLLIPFGSGIVVPLGLPNGFDTVTSLAGLAAAGLLLANLLLTRSRQRDLSLTVVIWLALLTVAALSYFWTIDAQATAAEVRVLASLIALYVLVRLISVEKRDVRLFEAAVVTGGAIVGAVAVYQLATNQIALSGGDVPRFRIGGGGEGGDPNITAATLLLPIAIGLGRGLEGLRHLRGVAYLLGAALAVVAVTLTASRGGFVALIVLVAVLALHERRPAVVAAYAMVPVVAAVSIFAFAPAPLAQRVDAAGSTGRTEIWRLAVASCPTYCWAGAGAGSFRAVHERELLKTAGATGRHLNFEAHNFLLAAAIELGFVGTALALLGIATGAVETRAAERRDRAPALAALAGVVVANLFVSNFAFKYFWLALIYAALVNQAREGPAATQVRAQSRMSAASPEGAAA